MVESAILSKAEYLSSELYPDLKPFRPLKAHFSTCRMFDGSTQERIRRIGSESIIQLFEHTPDPEQPQDVVYPRFLELKWGYGCPYDCAWCLLNGTPYGKYMNLSETMKPRCPPGFRRLRLSSTKRVYRLNL